MEHKANTYFTLKYGQTDSLHKKGEVLVVPSGELHLGEQADCKVLFENKTDYEDELYAIIRPTRQEGEWQIIPTSDFIHTFVNGQPINLVHYLQDGDRIAFDNNKQELLFSIREDNKFNAAKGVQLIAAPMPRLLLAFVIALPVVLFGGLVGFLYHNNQAEEKRLALLDSLSHSILQISVDSVQYMIGDSVTEYYSYQQSEGRVINGTAFVTDEGRIITARHCIEPWLNEKVEDADSPNEVKSIPARWAMIAETYNQKNGGRLHKVVAICHLYRGVNGMEPFGGSYYSSEFEIDSTRDYIIEKGDFKNDYYWRSIKETYANKEMMLGDVAWIGTDSMGMLSLAPKKDMRSLLTSRQTLYFGGYPDHNTLSGFSTEEGKMQMNYEDGGMLAHSGNLIQGYSGAPAIIIRKGKAFVVGVVSRIDANGGGRTYSVPITELKEKGGKE